MTKTENELLTEVERCLLDIEALLQRTPERSEPGDDLAHQQDQALIDIHEISQQALTALRAEQPASPASEAGEVIMRAGRCGHHYDEGCRSCRAALECTNAEMDRLRALSRPSSESDARAREPWGYGWYENGGKKMASGYLPTISYPRSEDVSEGPFPLYRSRPSSESDAGVELRKLEDALEEALQVELGDLELEEALTSQAIYVYGSDATRFEAMFAAVMRHRRDALAKLEQGGAGDAE